MAGDNVASPTLSQDEEFMRTLPRRHSRRGRDYSQLDIQTYQYLCTDKQWLRNEYQRAKQAGDSEKITNLARRLEYYYRVEDLFFYLIEQDRSTALIDITAGVIQDFLQRQYSISQIKPMKQALTPGLAEKRAQDREKTELKAFFSRAEKEGVIQQNPLLPFNHAAQLLRPENLSFRALADCQAFEQYLRDRINDNLLSPLSSEIYYRNFLILLHDAELRNADNPNWPTELDDLFSNPKWIAEWLNNLQNRSAGVKSKELARSSLRLYLLTIRHIWLFLKSHQRVTKTFYDDLKELFRVDERFVILPGRSPRKITALSEQEEAAVFQCIDKHSSRTVLRLRDKAMFITAIQTTIRVQGLNSMRIENIREKKPGSGTFVCYVITKRSARKHNDSADELEKDNMVWGDWFMSREAILAIEEYLKETGRSWKSKGPVWLTDEGQPLSLRTQKNLIRDWLKSAGCKITRPHVLRHTGIERLINKYNLPIPIVQHISQHKRPTILLDVYAQGATIDAFYRVNQVLPIDNQTSINCRDLLLSVGAKLNEISAGISRRYQDRSGFNRQQAIELLELLAREISRLNNFLGSPSASKVVILSPEDFERLSTALREVGLSYEKIAGHDLDISSQTITKSVGRKPKPLLGR